MPTKTKGIDFGSLTLRDALDLAAIIEEEAQERYEELADSLEKHRTPEAAKFFRFMARNEERHKIELQSRRRELFGSERRGVTRQMIFDVEAPEYDEARASMTARQALAAAMRAEVKAHDFFVDVLPSIADAKVKALFEELRDEELEHQRLVREQVEKTPPDPLLRAEEFEDDPTAQ